MKSKAARLRAWKSRNKEKRIEYLRAWRARNKEKINEWNRRYRKNKGKDKVNEYNRRYREKHKDKVIEYNRRYREKHGVSTASVKRWRARNELKLVEIAGRPRQSLCEICKEHNLRIVFDHCHANGIFRGWICSRCNVVLGHVKDNPRLLRKMAKYLEQANGRTHSSRTEENPDKGIWFTVGEEISDK